MDIETTTINTMQENNIPQHTGPIGIGEKLKAAREAAQLTEKEAAARMRLSPKFITIMENEEFNNAPPAAFMRGYLRSYAKLINLPEDQINNAITRLGMDAPPTKLASPMLHTPLDSNHEQYIRWITYLVAFVMVALVGAWWTSHSHDTERSKTLPLPQMAAAPESVQTSTPLPIATQQEAAPIPQPVTTNIAPAPTPNNLPPAANTVPAPTPAATPAPAATQAPVMPNAAPMQANPAVIPAPAAVASPGTAPAPATNEEPHFQMAVPEPGLDTNDW